MVPRSKDRGLADYIVPPAVWHSEASFPARRTKPDPGGRAVPTYTPPVRRWVCIVAMLVGFSGDGYAWTARPRIPVPIERLLDPRRPDAALPEGPWWRLT